MDSGAFTELAKHGEFRHSVKEYAEEINRWARCGNLEMAVTQDYMCEPFMLQKTGLSVRQHQELTINRYDELEGLASVKIMPVLQGFEGKEYLEHLAMYGERLTDGMRVGVGSVCKRNGNPQVIVGILEGIKNARPDLKIHGFGLKSTALGNAYIVSLLHSADSMAWSYAARREGGNANGLLEAQRFVEKIDRTQGKKPHQYIMWG